MSENNTLRVGDKAALNLDKYPAHGQWWVPIWDGDTVVARAYGDTPGAARAMAERLAAQCGPVAPAQCGLRPIATAPKDQYVLVRFPQSAYPATPHLFAVAILRSDPKGDRWLTHAGGDLGYWGIAPTEWMPIPKGDEA